MLQWTPRCTEPVVAPPQPGCAALVHLRLFSPPSSLVPHPTPASTLQAYMGEAKCNGLRLTQETDEAEDQARPHVLMRPVTIKQLVDAQVKPSSHDTIEAGPIAFPREPRRSRRHGALLASRAVLE